jgi:photosystem II protein
MIPKTMRSAAVLVLSAFVAVHAHEAKDSTDNVVDKLWDRVVQVPLLPAAGVDDATVGKAAAAPLRNAPPGVASRQRTVGGSLRRSALPLGRRPVMVHAASLQFFKGQDETCVPEVKLTKSRRSGAGTATFIFDEPSIFTDGQGDITGLYMIDDEGELVTTDVQAKYVNGKPDSVVAKYTMKDEYSWDRFMRFMERYGDSNDLGFKKTPKGGEEGTEPSIVKRSWKPS